MITSGEEAVVSNKDQGKQQEETDIYLKIVKHEVLHQESMQMQVVQREMEEKVCFGQWDLHMLGLTRDVIGELVLDQKYTSNNLS